MRFRKNKKSIAYFAFLGIFLIIIYFFLMISYESPNLENINEIKNYDTNLINLDILQKKFIIENFHKKEIINRIDDKIFSSLSSLNYLSNNEKLSRIDGECKINGINIWYDERKENKSICLIDFKEGISKTVEKIILSEKANLDLSTDSIIDVSYNNEKNKYEVKISNDLEKNSNYGGNLIKNNLNFDIEISDFEKVLKYLTEIIPQISQSNKVQIPKCLKNVNLESENKELFCIEENIKLQLLEKIKEKNDDINLLEKFDIKIENIKDSNLEDFFSLNVIIIENKSKQSLNLGLILEYNIPQNLISFSVSNFNGAENTLKLKINKPKSEKIEGYIILYSNENFFSKSYGGFNSLINILESGSVPKNINEVSFTRKSNVDGLNKDVKYHIFDDPNLNLNLINIGNGNFDKDTNEKIIYIFQKYNYNTKIFEKLNSNEELYFYVFAYDKNYNYYVDAIEESLPIKSKSESILNIKPLITNQNQLISKDLIISGSLDNMEKTISIKIPPRFYEDENFAGYDIYIFKDTPLSTINSIDTQCIDSQLNCQYFNWNVYGFNNPELDLILSSSQSVLEIVDDKIRLPVGNFNLENDKKYIISIIPVNNQGEGILKSIEIPYEININSAKNFYYIDNNLDYSYNPYINNILVKDNTIKVVALN